MIYAAALLTIGNDADAEPPVSATGDRYERRRRFIGAAGCLLLLVLV